MEWVYLGYFGEQLLFSQFPAFISLSQLRPNWEGVTTGYNLEGGSRNTIWVSWSSPGKGWHIICCRPVGDTLEQRDKEMET